MKAMDCLTEGGETIDAIVDVRYNEKGQQIRLEMGNGAVTTHEYQPETFRLQRIRTVAARPPGSGTVTGFRRHFVHPNVVQDSHYFYDAAGNITEIRERRTPDHLLRRPEGRTHMSDTATTRSADSSRQRDVRAPNTMAHLRNSVVRPSPTRQFAGTSRGTATTRRQHRANPSRRHLRKLDACLCVRIDRQ